MGLFGNADENEDNKKATLVLALIALMVIILGLITYLFFYNQEGVAYENETPVELAQSADLNPPAVDLSADSSVGDLQTIDSQPIGSQPAVVQPAPQPQPAPAPIAESAPEPIQVAQTPPPAPQPTPAPTPAPQPVAQPKPAPVTTAPKNKSTIASLKYTIKPNNADIYFCGNMRNGKWIMPKKCEEEILNAVQRLIDANNELIAIEVSGIVDGNPYSGPSAELKQEGLASFRAREGIIAIMRGYSNVAAFEGPSQQARGKRGFQVKAYYLQK